MPLLLTNINNVQLFLMNENLVGIRDTCYYHIINAQYHLALYISSGSQKFTEQQAMLSDPSQQSLGQTWQIIKITENVLYTNCYQIVHARSTLVLTNKEKYNVKLAFGKQIPSQLFYLELVKDCPNTYLFRAIQGKQNYLYYDQYLKVGKISPNTPKCQWKIQIVNQNEAINRSCYIQNIFSNLVIDVPQASTKSGVGLIQYRLNNRFNQRFKISVSKQKQQYYRIQSSHSLLFLSVHKKCSDGDKVTQQKYQLGNLRQCWIFLYQGKNSFIIRSVHNPKMFLGIKDNQCSQLANIITTSGQQYARWKIIGYLPKRKSITQF